MHLTAREPPFSRHAALRKHVWPSIRIRGSGSTEKGEETRTPLRYSPVHDEEETSDFPVEQLNEEASTTSHPLENADMEVEQVAWGHSDPTESNTEEEDNVFPDFFMP